MNGSITHRCTRQGETIVIVSLSCVRLVLFLFYVFLDTFTVKVSSNDVCGACVRVPRLLLP